MLFCTSKNCAFRLLKQERNRVRKSSQTMQHNFIQTKICFERFRNINSFIEFNVNLFSWFCFMRLYSSLYSSNEIIIWGHVICLKFS